MPAYRRQLTIPNEASVRGVRMRDVKEGMCPVWVCDQDLKFREIIIKQTQGHANRDWFKSGRSGVVSHGIGWFRGVPGILGLFGLFRGFGFFDLFVRDLGHEFEHFNQTVVNPGVVVLY